jgi:hypothetical protein
MALFWLTTGITTFILFIPFAIFFGIKYGKGEYLKISDYFRLTVASCILLIMYINRGFRPPFFD